MHLRTHFHFTSSKSMLHKNRKLQWRHNDHDGVSNHQPRGRLFNRLFRCRSKKTSKLCVTGLCAVNSPVTGEFPTQRASNAENASTWWHHHDSPGYTVSTLSADGWHQGTGHLQTWYCPSLHRIGLYQRPTGKHSDLLTYFDGWTLTTGFTRTQMYLNRTSALLPNKYVIETICANTISLS